MAKGINGVQYGTRPVPIDEARLPAVEKAAVEWLTALTAKFNHILENRVQYLMSSPSVMAALGALGHELVDIEDVDARRLKIAQLLQSISTVNWSRDKTWEGIAGKFTPKGSFSIGGAKETAYAVFGALTDANSTGYQRVRVAHVEKAA